MSLLNRKRYSKLISFCWFIGYPRTGHTLIAAILDAHSNIIISNEWNVIRYINKGYNKYMIFKAIEKSSYIFQKKFKSIWSDYDYSINGLSQGCSNNLLIIGDKGPGSVSRTLQKTPDILNKLEKVLDLPLKIIHVVRNPFDVISTMILRHCDRNEIRSFASIDYMIFINRFFNKVKINSKILECNSFQFITIYHEDVISQPEKSIISWLQFLELESDEDYIRKCCNLIKREPNRSRIEIPWDNDNIMQVQQEISKYEFLSHYSFYN